MSTPSKSFLRNQTQVTCPHCQATQSEPIGAISTNCRTCRTYFKLDAKRAQRVTRQPKALREIVCMKCGANNRVTTAAMSTQCVRCSTYLDLRDLLIRSGSTERIYTYGVLTFAPGSTYRSFEAGARRVIIQGKVFTKLTASHEVIVHAGGSLSGELYAGVVQVDRGGQVKVRTIMADRMIVEGEVEVSGKVKVRDLLVKAGGSLTAIQIVTHHIQVEPGGYLQGQLKTEPMEKKEMAEEEPEEETVTGDLLNR